nr:AAA family ATPase [Paenibacillus sp. NEAU-GSW1]
MLEVQIDGYGQLHRFHCRLDGETAVFYGLNEAGKSTLFSFIRTMLYGFSRRGNDAERQEPVHGGKHGGQLKFEDALGDMYQIERYASIQGGKPLLRPLRISGAEPLVAESWLTQEEWERRFLNGVGEKLFRQLYAVTLTELQQVGALAGDELGRYLYDAGLEGGKAIANAEKKLQQELDLLFKPRGTTQLINKQLKALEHTEAELRRQTDTIDGYNAMKRSLDQLERELERIECELPLRHAKAQMLAKAVAVRPQWLRRLELEREREGLAMAERISAEAEQQWRELERERGDAASELERERRQQELEQLQRESLDYDEALIARSEEAEALLLESERTSMLHADRVELASELRSDDEAIGRLLGRIAPEWTEEQLRRSSFPIADREHARGVRLIEAEAARLAERLAAEISHAEAQERDAVRMLEEIEAQANESEEHRRSHALSFVPRTSEALQTAWLQFESAMREWELERLRASASADAGGEGAPRGSAGLLWAAVAAAGGAAFVLAAIGALAGGDGSAGLIGAAAGLGALAAALAASAWRSGRAGGRRAKAAVSRGSAARGGGGKASLSMLRQREQRVNEALAQLVEAPAEAAAALFASPRGEAAPELALAAQQARERLHAAVLERREALQRRERLHAGRQEQQRRLQRLSDAAAERRAAAQAAAERRSAAALAWRAWLAERDLSTAMSPDAALEAFELAEQALQRLQQRDRRAARHAAAGRQLAAFEAQAAQLCAAVPEAAKHSAPLSLRLLQAELRRQAAAQQEAARLDARLAERGLAIRGAEARIGAAAEAGLELARQAGMASAPAFAAALDCRARLMTVDAELNRIEIELTAGLSSQRQEELEKWLAGHDEAELEALLKQCLQEAESAERMKAEQLEARGRLRQQLEHLLQEDEGRRLIADKEMALAQLEQDADRYAVLSVSLSLIRATKKIYEEERQPEVLRLASGYVQELTGGRYTRVLTKPGDASIWLVDYEQRQVESGMLSRGTAEQVYLSMRLALAEEASRNTGLPLMLDDLFVNFDKPRLQAAARLMGRLSSSRQLLLFTCHDHVRDLLRQQLTQAKSIAMSGTLNAVLRHSLADDQIEPTEADESEQRI